MIHNYILPYTYTQSLEIYSLRIKQHTSTCVKFTHPLHPMQTNHMHQTLHYVQHQHHPDRRHEKDQTSDDRDAWVLT